MRTWYVFLVFFAFFYAPLSWNIIDVIYILGPSCAGKTTTAVHLAKELGESWHLVEFDLFEEKIGRNNASEQEIFSQTIKEAHQKLADGKQVIIDTNRYFSSLCTLTQNGHNILKVYIYAPLKTLLKRYEARRKKYHHRKHTAKWIRKFIARTFYTFYPKGIPTQSDLVINTTKIPPHQVLAIITNALARANNKEHSSKNID